MVLYDATRREFPVAQCHSPMADSSHHVSAIISNQRRPQLGKRMAKGNSPILLYRRCAPRIYGWEPGTRLLRIVHSLNIIPFIHVMSRDMYNNVRLFYYREEEDAVVEVVRTKVRQSRSGRIARQIEVVSDGMFRWGGGGGGFGLGWLGHFTYIVLYM